MSGFVLLLDSGNTQLKCRALTGGEGNRWQMAGQYTLSNQNPEALEKLIYSLQHVLGKLKASYLVGVSDTALQKKWQMMLSTFLTKDNQHFLKVQEKQLGLYNHYAIEQLGADRWYSVLGVYAKHQEKNTPFLVVSFGTASTIDAVWQEHYWGGIILPGLQLMQKSLFQGTAKLPEVSFQSSPSQEFAQNTLSAIEEGILMAQVGAILSQCKKIREKTGLSPKLYISGGARHLVLPFLKQAQEGALLFEIEEIAYPVLDGMQSWLMSEKLFEAGFSISPVSHGKNALNQE